ncbi:hypothetical protein MLD38_025245 [Melastoma candidum]|uniref:Uncharacterized protein n=1 Tax=Melastoma candidum TaxID=119954 RepID=A0ACB9NWI0_9MYRT|nr:hypothetical protein MLD38_025245 [Melastoma candidum]
MQSLSGSCGLPLCISGITRSIPFPKQIADHDRRRKALMRRIRSGSRGAEANRVSAASSRRDAEGGGDLSGLIHDLCEGVTKPCIAKAA